MTENENKLLLRGLNLRIDTAIDKVCETSNKSSSNTRSIMYVLVVVSILSLVSVMNTHIWNWTNARIKRSNQTIDKLDSSLSAVRNHMPDTSLTNLTDSLKVIEQLDLARINVQLIKRNQIENFQTVKVPILGNAFDVNNLSLVAGITIFVLMYILKFTMYREITNLRIALNSISERYPSNSDHENFYNLFSYVRSLNPKDGEFSDEDILAKINYTRRIYHYNFLSMNEVFNLPPVKYSIENKLVVNSFILMNIFYFPTIAYAVVLLNDITTFQIGFRNAPGLTIFTLFAGLFFLWRIGRHSRFITSQKQDLLNLYKKFQEDDYHHA